jgi:hypothetical protein
MSYYYFIAGAISTEAGNVITNSEVSLPAPIESYATVKDVERKLAEDFNTSTFTVTFYTLLRQED